MVRFFKPKPKKEDNKKDSKGAKNVVGQVQNKEEIKTLIDDFKDFSKPEDEFKDTKDEVEETSQPESSTPQENPPTEVNEPEKEIVEEVFTDVRQDEFEKFEDDDVQQVRVIERSKKRFKFKQLSEDVISFACHGGENVVVTKNGDLMYSISILGFDENHILDYTTIQAQIRDLVRKHVMNDELTVWLNTVRIPERIDPKITNLSSESEFANEVHAKWIDLYNVNNMYASETTITLVMRNCTPTMGVGIKSLITSFTGHNEDYFEKGMKKAILKMQHYGETLKENLSQYRLAVNGIYRKGSTYKSGMLSLFHSLIFGKKKDINLPIYDMSYESHMYKIHNTKEGEIVVDHNGEIKHVRVLHVKLSMQDFSHIVQIITNNDFTMSICQILEKYNTKLFPLHDSAKHYSSKTNPLREPFADIIGQNIFSYQKEETRKQTPLQALTNKINQVKALKDKEDTKYSKFGVKSQLSIALYNETEQGLEKDLKHLESLAGRYGIIMCKEDLISEDTFYSLVPGNFRYIRRMIPCTNRDIASFVSLKSSTGLSVENWNNMTVWDKPVAIFRTKANDNFFFHFHSPKTDKSCICISGEHGSGKNALANFLVSQSLKFRPIVICVSASSNKTDVFIRAIDGQCLSITPIGYPSLNPFGIFKYMEDKTILKQAEKFVVNMCINLAKITSSVSLIESEMLDIKHAVISVAKKCDNPDFVPCMDEVISSLTSTTTKNALSVWGSTGKLSGLFSAQEDVFDSINKGECVLFDVYDLLDRKLEMQSVIKYILYRIDIISQFTNKVVVKIDDPWKVLTTKSFPVEKFYQWVNIVNKRHIPVIITLTPEESYIANITSSIMQHLSYQVFFGVEHSNLEVYKKIFALSEREILAVSSIARTHNFMARNETGHVICQFEVKDLGADLGILAGDKIALRVWKELQVSPTATYTQWQPEFLYYYNKYLNADL